MEGMHMGPPSPSTNGTTAMAHPHKMMMHMTFFWGSHTEILFPGWPGSDPGMYALALLLVFVLSVLVEFLSHSRLIRAGSGHVAAGLARTLMHAVRVGLAYMVMLAVMSFNVGVFLVAVAGHAVGFWGFGRNRGFEEGAMMMERLGKGSDLPPMSC